MGNLTHKLCLSLLLILVATLGTAAEKTALVIGVGHYKFGPDLRTPVADARAIANRLDALGFDTYFAEDPSQPDILLALARFRLASASASTSVIFFAGHGVRWQGETYVLASDTPFSDATGLLARSVPVSVMLATLSDKVRNKIVLIDACRDLPDTMQALSSSRISPGFGNAKSNAGSYVLFSAQPGAGAYDGLENHSPFANALLSALDQTHDLSEFGRVVRNSVVSQTNGQQIPWSQSSMLTRVLIGGG